MALSNALSNSILKPGVCTSSARPSNPYEGQFIYETDTDALLVYNGSSWICPSGPSSDPTLTNQFTRKSYVDSLHTTAYNRGSLGVTNAATAQTAANNAQTTANAAMPKAGGTFTGSVNMGSQYLFLKNGLNSQHYLRYDPNIDGAELAGLVNVVIYLNTNGTLFAFKSDGKGYAPVGWVTSSSVRYKEDIRDIDYSDLSAKIDSLRPVTYRKKESDSATSDYGFIAEEVQEVFPEVIGYNDDGEAEGIDYGRVSVLAIAEIKNLKNRINILEETVAKLLETLGTDEVEK